jgi:hypothetical protein
MILYFDESRPTPLQRQASNHHRAFWKNLATRAVFDPVAPPIVKYEGVPEKEEVPTIWPIHQWPNIRFLGQCMNDYGNYLGFSHSRFNGDLSTKIRDIQRATCRELGVTLTELISPRRTAGITTCRQISMYICKKLTLRSLPEIGRHFGGRDHTTILHAVRKITKLLDERDEKTTSAVNKIMFALGRY